MTNVYHIELISPTVKTIGIVTNKQLAFGTITNTATANNNSSIHIDEGSDKFDQYHRKMFNYVNFARYFKNADHRTSVSVKIINPNSEQSSAPALKVRCTVYETNKM